MIHFFICDSILPSFLEFVKTILIHVKILYNIESKKYLHFVDIIVLHVCSCFADS